MHSRPIPRWVPPAGELHRLLANDRFYFDRLVVSGIDNEPVIRRLGKFHREAEECLLSSDCPSGDAAVEALSGRIGSAIGRQALPVVRFADGEYLFYLQSMKCNGLYQQAESVEAIREALPNHYKAMRWVAENGILANLVSPMTVRGARRTLRKFWKRTLGDDLAVRFLDLAAVEGVWLTHSNYVPFFAVYAYLSSPEFCMLMDGRVLGVVTSDFNAAAMKAWFARRGSCPSLVHVPISPCHVATGWHRMRDTVMRQLDPSVDLWMVGAGIGALEVCADIARTLSRPAIDSGHVLNVMNSLEWKSNGPRLYIHST